MKTNEKYISAIKAESNILHVDKIADSGPNEIGALAGTVYEIPSQI
jgi:hypothetical protein